MRCGVMAIVSPSCGPAFASDYAIWTPKWIVDAFMAFELPEDIAAERGVALTLDVKRKILGANAAALYDIDIDAKRKKLAATSRESDAVAV